MTRDDFHALKPEDPVVCRVVLRELEDGTKEYAWVKAVVIELQPNFKVRFVGPHPPGYQTGTYTMPELVQHPDPLELLANLNNRTNE